MTLPHPGPRNIIWPQEANRLLGSWDTDAQFGRGQWFLPYHTIFLAYEPLTMPAVAADAVRYPVPTDLVPRLAESWSADDGYRTWTVRLREGVRSDFGNELTAEDVVWGWRRVYALKGVGLWRSRRIAGLPSPDGITAVDDRTVRFSLPHPNPELPQHLSFATNLIFDSKEARRHGSADDPWAQGWLAKNTAGYGPFRLAEQSAEALVMTPRDEYWQGRPPVDSMSHIGAEYREEGHRQLERGEANLLTGLFPEELARYANRPEFQIVRMRANHSTLEFNWLEPPFDDQHVRKAVALALPYGEILERVYGGYAAPSKSHFTKVTNFYTEEFWGYDTDLEKAREQLRLSAHPDGFATELYLMATPESVRFGEIARLAMKQIGIDVSLRFVNGQQFGTKVPMWFYEECSHALNEAMYDLSHEFDQPVGMNNGRSLRDERWIKRIRAIREAEAADQPQLYREIQRDLLDFLPCVPIAELQTGWVARSDIDPWVLGPNCIGVSSTIWNAHRSILPFL